MPDIKTLAAARNVDLVDTFTKSIAKLAKMLSACDPIKANVGETLHQKRPSTSRGRRSRSPSTPGPT